MSKAHPTSFRLPQRLVLFLDHIATQHNATRTEVLIKMLELYLRKYLADGGTNFE